MMAAIRDEEKTIAKVTVNHNDKSYVPIREYGTPNDFNAPRRVLNATFSKPTVLVQGGADDKCALWIYFCGSGDNMWRTFENGNEMIPKKSGDNYTYYVKERDSYLKYGFRDEVWNMIGPSAFNGSIDVGMYQIANHVKYASNEIVNRIINLCSSAKKRNEKKCVCVQGHSRGAVAACKVMEMVAQTLQKYNVSKYIELYLVIFDPVPGQLSYNSFYMHDFLYTKGTFDNMKSTVIYSMYAQNHDSSSMATMFLPMIAYNADHYIITQYDHEAGIRLGFDIEGQNLPIWGEELCDCDILHSIPKLLMPSVVQSKYSKYETNPQFIADHTNREKLKKNQMSYDEFLINGWPYSCVKDSNNGLTSRRDRIIEAMYMKNAPIYWKQCEGKK
ncbi:MAG TPA: hypothetical protein VHO70_11740 [Chitinispirillaceae bacterium]|nr:hypothetical protein [Chitinispirillaceae bacterium]